MRPPSPSLSSPHPELLSFIRNNPSSAPKPLLSLTDIHNTRAFIRLFNSVLKDTSSNNPVSYKIQDIQVPARDGALLPGRVYTPKKTRTKTGMPGLYICHGGGYVIGELAGQEWIAEVWCKLGGVVVDILYRHAPETKWPGAVDDAVDGWGWMLKNLGELGVNSKKGLVVGGDSTGGDLAAIIAHLHAQEEPLGPMITGLYMACPMVMDASCVPARYMECYRSMEENKDAMCLTKESVDVILALYQPDITSPLAFPILFDDHSKLPKTYIQVCGMDPLRDGGLIFEQVLKDSGVETKLDVYPGLPHCFWGPFMHAEVTRNHKKDVEEGMKWLLGLSK